MENRKKILIFIGGGGGFTFQALTLVDCLGESYAYFYVILEKEEWIQSKINIPGKVIQARRLLLTGDNLMKIIIKIIRHFFESFFILRNTNPDVIIIIGSPIGIPFCLWGKILKKKVIFFESIARVIKGSLTARFIYRLRIADRFYVQWPELKREFPKAIYKGRIA